MRAISNILTVVLCLFSCRSHGFSARSNVADASLSVAWPNQRFVSSSYRARDTTVGCGTHAYPSRTLSPRSRLCAASIDVEMIGLVVGQENYGLAVVSLGEAAWSFAQAPSLSQLKVFLPGVLAAIVLTAVSGPMVTSGDLESIGTGLSIATVVSMSLGLNYAARVAAPFGEPAKGVAFLGLLFSIAGFFSFSQNLVVDGFITLPNIPLPSLPMPQGDGGVDYDAIMSMQDAPVSAETAESIDLL